MEIKTTANFDLGPIQALVREYFIPYETSHASSQEFPTNLVEKMHELGIFLSPGSKEYGGKSLAVADLIWLIQELSYGSPSMAATFIGNLLGYSALLLHGEGELKERVARQYAQEQSLWSFGMTEAGAGSDLLNLQTTARRVKGGFLLDGEKNFITNASHSSHLCVFAQLLSEKGEKEGISAFYIQGNNPGLSRGPALAKIGWQKANTGSLLFKNAFLPEYSILGKAGDGLRILTHCLNRSKTLLAAMGVGIANRALDLCTERLSETKRFGKPLLEQATIRHLLARLHTQKEAAWMLTCKAASTWDAGLDATKESSMAKLFSGAMSVETCRQAMELFGARGYLHDFEVSRLASDAKGIEIIEGPSFVQELLIARMVLPKTNGNKQANPNDQFRLLQKDLKRAS